MNKKKILMIILTIILLIPTIYGIGVGIWVEEVEFTPNLNQNFNAFINNNMGYDAKVKLTARGGLAEYVTFSEEYLDIGAGGRAFFTFNLKLPESIPPGRNRIDIGAEDVTSTAGGGISAKTAAFIGFYVRAPYPGKYIEASFRAPNIEKDQVATFYVDILSRGNETINKIDGIVEIFDQNNKIAEVAFAPITNIQPKESRTMEAKWDSAGHKVGEYTAKATVNYDGNQSTLDTTFKIGTLLVRIINYTKEFYKDEINQFDVEIQGFWNTQIDKIYGEITVNKEKIKTLETSLSPWTATKITAYIDTHNLELGEHTANIKVYYEGNVAEELGKIVVLPKREKVVEKVVELPSKLTSTTILLVVIIILLVIGNIILVFHFLKHKKTSEKPEETQEIKKEAQKRDK